jgi:alpha-1,6-mannosyltransferase
MKHWRIVASGVALAIAFAALRQWGTRDGSAPFFWLLGAAALAYAVAIRELFRQRFPPRALVVAGLVLALLWRVPLALAPVGRDGDVYRYIWDARLQRAGLNPYTVRPDDPAVAWVHSPLTLRMNNPGVPSPYPPVAQLYFRAVTAVRETPEAIKVSLVLCEALLVLVLWRWLAWCGLDPCWVLAYAWHPLATLETARNGHFDVFGVLLLCASAAALLRGWRRRAAVCFALAIGARLLPIVLAPVYWKRLGVRDAAIASAVLLACSAPFIREGTLPAGSIPHVVSRFRFNAPLYELTQTLVGVWGAAAVAVAAGLGVALACRRWDAARTPGAWAWPLAAALACSPLVYPWYLVWLLPFLTGVATVPLTAWSLSVMSTYAVWQWFAAGASWRVPGTVLALEYLPPMVVGCWVLWTWRTGLRTTARIRRLAGPTARNIPD